ncbi:MAG: response regulator transcription factor [Candidatus Obscuribacter sp.]|nr:response regulator transcription factor [Candidatus Obscuribacter sp.]
MQTLSVLICEDLPALRLHARQVLTEVFAGKAEIKIEEAQNGQEAIKKAKTHKPALILMDIAMPEVNGIKAASAIWASAPHTKILFWSQYQHEAYIRELGKIVPDEAIHGYLLKSESDEQLKEAITSVYFSDLPYIGKQIEAVKHRLRDKTSAITDLEYQTLLDIFAGLTDKAIAQKEHISYRGAQNRLSTLLNKILKGEDSYLRETAGKEVFNPRTRLIYEALRRGLISMEDQNQLEEDLDNWLFSEYGWEKQEV